MLFFGKENVFMCFVAFQKMFQKIFSDVWLCSWKYHRKHIFYLLLTFSQLPNEYIISFIPQNTNKTQKKIIKSEQTKARSWSRSARLRSRSTLRAIARCVDHDHNQRRSVRCRWSHGGVWDARWSAFRTLSDRRLDRSLSLSLSVFCSRGFFLSVALSLSFARAMENVWR